MPTAPLSYLLADKPAGIPTHSPQPPREGFVEYLQRRRGQRLWVCHRLDSGTSGALVLARDEGAARHLTGLFAAGRVDKAYLLVSDRAPGRESAATASRIERRGKAFVSRDDAPHNAFTRFTLVRRRGRFALWRAVPSSGRPHQIRLHARDLGLPILGDPLYGGAPFPRLMLHAERIGFADAAGAPLVHASSAPPLFNDLALLEDAEYAAWLAALDRRDRLLGEEKTCRLIHREADGLRCDRFGETCWFYWYRPGAPDGPESERLGRFAAAAGARHWTVRLMHNRGKRPQGSAPPQELPFSSWTATENGLLYRFKSDQGLSPGLFLDQRQNRSWVRERARGRSVLNLFCYTGGFSLNALAGGAAQVTSVDTSKRTLEWARDNFRLNGFDPEAEGVEFRALDARLFLRGCRRRGRRFDLIVCDPPSFARTKEGAFRIERDLPELARDLWEALETDGRALICCNYEKWDQAAFAAVLADALPQAVLADAPPPDWDYELPGEEPLLKAAVLSKAGR